MHIVCCVSSRRKGNNFGVRVRIISNTILNSLLFISSKAQLPLLAPPKDLESKRKRTASKPMLEDDEQSTSRDGSDDGKPVAESFSFDEIQIPQLELRSRRLLGRQRGHAVFGRHVPSAARLSRA